ncbi:MAG: PAS domain-containing sensor histidine kinase [Thiovulaceae bacterium]|nr:PAS domain-containing sensor histidine kinase [Sulfurimonadaceae bacterium]
MPFDLLDLQAHDSELLRLLTRNLPDMLWVKDLDGKYLYANQAICEGLLMAKDTQEPIGKTDIFFAMREREAHKENPDWHTFGELCFNSDLIVIENNKPMKFEEFGNVRGKMLYLEVYKAPFYDKEGKILGTVGAGRDITQLKQSQLDLQMSLDTLKEQREELASFNQTLEKRVKEEMQKQKTQEKMMLHQSRQAAMGELLESIAHQWRQPLNIIGLATVNLETLHAVGNLSDEEFDEKIRIITSNIAYMSQTIDDFRKFLSPEKHSGNFDPNASIRNALMIIDAQRKSAKTDISLELQENIELSGIANEFQQVLIILLNNALDAIKHRLQTAQIERGAITITSKQNDNVIRIEVSDNGGGIDPKSAGNIFEPYFSTKSNTYGTGIGLYIAKNIVESRMRGKIGFSPITSGTCFYLEFPSKKS